MPSHASELFAFANTLRAQKLGPRTRSLYVGAIRRFDTAMRDAGTSARSASFEQVLDYADTLAYTYATRNTFIRAYKHYWHHLKRTGPCAADSVFCPKRPEMFYRGLDDGAAARAVISAAASIDIRAEAACALGYFAALRCAEIAALPRDAVQGDWLHVMGKGARKRELPIVDELDDVLTRLLGAHESPWALPGRGEGAHVSTNTVLTWVRLAGERAGLGRVTTHMLRYTAGGVMLDETDDLAGVGKYLGHSRNSMSVTSGYTRRKADKLKRLGRTL